MDQVIRYHVSMWWGITLGYVSIGRVRQVHTALSFPLQHLAWYHHRQRDVSILVSFFANGAGESVKNKDRFIAMDAWRKKKGVGCWNIRNHLLVASFCPVTDCKVGFQILICPQHVEPQKLILKVYIAYTNPLSKIYIFSSQVMLFWDFPFFRQGCFAPRLFRKVVGKLRVVDLEFGETTWDVGKQTMEQKHAKLVRQLVKPTWKKCIDSGSGNECIDEIHYFWYGVSDRWSAGWFLWTTGYSYLWCLISLILWSLTIQMCPVMSCCSGYDYFFRVDTVTRSLGAGPKILTTTGYTCLMKVSSSHLLLTWGRSSIRCKGKESRMKLTLKLYNLILMTHVSRTWFFNHIFWQFHIIPPRHK